MLATPIEFVLTGSFIVTESIGPDCLCNLQILSELTCVLIVIRNNIQG